MGAKQSLLLHGKRKTWWMVAALALVAGVVCYLKSLQTGRPVLPPPPEPMASRFLNVSEANFTGSQVCGDCHDEQQQAYQQTNHRLALNLVHRHSEPPASEFRHAASGKTYRVFADQSQLRHQELIVTAGKQEEILADYPLKYRVGSGHLARTYLIEVDGFLSESPITWYSSRKEWRMSPGYDVPSHPGFSRPVSKRCLLCHAGRVEAVEDTYHRFRIHELGIGCERCHGPGSLHVEMRESDEGPGGAEDLTIVHPGRLTRSEQDDICAQCHLTGDVDVMVRGRDPADFRPGLRLKDFRLSYRLQADNDDMTVVGHVEQMRLSRCYQASDTLTCITCHDPHQKVDAKNRLAFYRAKCLACHAEQGCGLESQERLSRNAQDDCTACHMPASPTEVPHLASTHHRIGLRGQRQEKPAPPTAGFGLLVPIEDVSHLPAIERDRCLGLAYLDLAKKPKRPAAVPSYLARAADLLQKVYDQGIRDAEVEAGLARIHWQRQPARALELAESAIQSPSASAEARSTALFVAADIFLKTNRTDRAISTLEELIRIRRHSIHWTMLAQCRIKQGEFEKALEALHLAAKASPDRADIQNSLADVYEQMGDRRSATRHRERARLLQRNGGSR